MQQVSNRVTHLQVLQRLQQTEQGGLAGNSQILVGTLDAELEPVVLSKAAQHGLPAAWVNRLAKFDPERRQVLNTMLTAH